VPANSDAASTTLAFSLAALSTDLALFDTRLFDLCLRAFWPRLRALAVDTTLFGQCLTLFGDQLRARRALVADALVGALVAAITEVFVNK
jgi:hypothetical protein